MAIELIRPPIITDWTDYTMTIGAVTTPPTKGTVTIDKAQWRRNGSMMEIRYDYAQTNSGSGGSGVYLFPLPFGSIDTARISSLNYQGITAGTVGFANVTVSSASPEKGSVNIYDATRLMMSVGESAQIITNVGSAFRGLGNLTVNYSFTASVPISGWSANS